jgi:putative Holliday junction resolvase
LRSREQFRILAIDYGSKRVGVAVSDPLRVISRGVGTFSNDETLLPLLASIVGRENVRLIVVGMPYSPDGGRGEKAVEVEQFIERLKEEVAVEVVTWDESFSSVKAHETLRASGMRRNRRQEKERVDVMAARLILQEYLDQYRE